MATCSHINRFSVDHISNSDPQAPHVPLINHQKNHMQRSPEVLISPKPICQRKISFEPSAVNLTDSLTTAPLANDNQSPSLAIFRRNFTYPQTQTKRHVTLEWLWPVCEKLIQKIYNLKDELTKRSCLSLLATQKMNNINKAIELFEQQIGSQLAEVTNNKSNLNIDDLKILSLAFEKLANLLPNSAEKELSQLINTHLLFDWSRLSKHALHEAKVKELSFLSTPSNFKASETGISAIVGSSIYPIIGVNQTSGPYIECEIGASRGIKHRTNDESKVYKEKITSPFLSASGGCKWSVNKLIDVGISGKITTETSRKKWKKWKNVEHYVCSKGHQLCWDNRREKAKQSFWRKLKNKIAKYLGLSSELKRYKKYQEAAENSQHRLNQLVQQHLTVHQQVSVPIVERIKPTKGHTTIYAAKANASGGTKTAFGTPVGFKVGINSAIRYKFQKLTKYEGESKPLWQHTDANPLKKVPSQFYASMAQLLENQTSVTPINDALNAFEQHVTEYVTLVQQYDYAKKAKNLKHQAKQLRKLKHTFENQLGAIGRHDTWQHLICQFTYVVVKTKELLTDQQDDQCQITAAIQSKIEHISKLLANPQMTYSKSKLDKLANAKRYLKKNYSEHIVEIEIDVPIFKGKITLLKRYRHHQNRLRSGKYQDFTVSGIFNPSLQNEISGADLATAIKEIALRYGHEIIPDFSLLPNIGVEAEISFRERFFKPQFTEDPDYQGPKNWQKLWRRKIVHWKPDFNIGLKGRGTVHPGVYVGAGVKYKRYSERVAEETLGTRSLIYSTMLFNRYYTDSGNTPNNIPWRTFTDTHQRELTKILINLHKGQATLKETIAFWKAELETFEIQNPNHITINQVTNKFTQLDTAIAKLATNSNDSNYRQALTALENILSMQVIPWQKQSDSHWAFKAFKAKSAQKKVTRALVKLHLHKRLKCK